MEYLQKQDGLGLKGAKEPKDYDPHEDSDTVDARWERVGERQGKAGRENIPERVDDELHSLNSAGLQSNIKRMLGM